jgi:hypothetical protein
MFCFHSPNRPSFTSSVIQPIRLFDLPYIRLSIHISLHVSNYQSAYYRSPSVLPPTLYLSLHLSLHETFRMFVSPSTHLFICSSTYSSTHPYIHFSVCPSGLRHTKFTSCSLGTAEKQMRKDRRVPWSHSAETPAI